MIFVYSNLFLVRCADGEKVDEQKLYKLCQMTLVEYRENDGEETCSEGLEAFEFIGYGCSIFWPAAIKVFIVTLGSYNGLYLLWVIYKRYFHER